MTAQPPRAATSGSPARRAALVLPPLRRLVAQRDRLARELAETRMENERLAARIATLSSQPSVTVPDDLGYLFIVTYGRSGSTLLQGVLNTIPGYVIRGENRDAVRRLFEYHSGIVKEKQAQSGAKQVGPRSSWYGIKDYPEESSIRMIRELVVRGLLRPGPARVTGYKEIRWWHEDWEQYFDFLERVFPAMRVVINTRDHAAVAQSSWYKNNPRSPQVLERCELRLDEIEQRFGSRAHRVHYDDWVADPEVLRGLFGWLGEPYDEERVRSVMAVKHSH